jgi:hypothetical protein
MPRTTVIISHARRFVFVKTRKTAGSSIELALRHLCDSSDVITDFGEGEVVGREIGRRGPQNTSISLQRLDVRGWWTPAHNRRRPSFYDHMPAYRIRSIAGRQMWRHYLTATIERNPWDRAVSAYFWLRHRQPERYNDAKGLTNFLHDQLERDTGWMSNWYLYTAGDEIIVDRVLRFEQLKDDLYDLWTSITDDPIVEIHRLKSGPRVDRRHYSEIMSDEDRELISDACASEIAHFGYTF